MYLVLCLAVSKSSPYVIFEDGRSHLAVADFPPAVFGNLLLVPSEELFRASGTGRKF